MCLDAGNTRNDGDRVTVHGCAPGHRNVTFVIDRGVIQVADTL